MKKLRFKLSSAVSVGVELEFQIIDPMTYDLISRAKDLIRSIRESPFQKRIKPEITQSMIEINSSIHHSPQKMHEEFLEIRNFLLEKAKLLGIVFSGGGTHPFQKWTLRKIFPTKRYKNITHHYRYLSKRSTVFGQHVHIGCANGDDAIFLTHAMARYVPHFVAISASSPFYQGIDTGYQSSRLSVFNAFPTSGVIPYLKNWKEFTAYYRKLKGVGVIESMKDIYWDIRPKPEFGTVEIRVCDTPLTIEKAIMIAAYIQSVACYLLKEKKFILNHDLYFLYHFNRFQASRYGFEGKLIQHDTLQSVRIKDDILQTIELIEPHVAELGNMEAIFQIKNDVANEINDTRIIRQIFKEVHTLPKLVHEQCIKWTL